jgi:hypothetical protein
MKKIIIIFCILIFSINTYSQKIDGICNGVNNIGYAIQLIEFSTYQDYKIDTKYSSINEVKNESVESLMKSQYSVKDNDWLSLNYGKKMNWSQEQFDRLNQKGNSLELLCKLFIRYDNIDYCILKMNMLGDKTPKSISIIMEKNKDRWQFSDNTLLQDANFIFTFFSTNDLSMLFGNYSQENEKELSNAINNSWIQNNFNYNNFINSFSQILFSGNYKKSSYEKAVNRNNVKLDIIKGIVPLSKQSYCYFFPNENSNYNDKNLNSLMGFAENSKKEKEIIIPNYYFKFNLENNENYIFSYNLENTETKIKETKIFQLVNNQIIDNSKLTDVFSQMKEKSNDYILKEKKKIVIK